MKEERRVDILAERERDFRFADGGEGRECVLDERSEGTGADSENEVSVPEEHVEQNRGDELQEEAFEDCIHLSLVSQADTEVDIHIEHHRVLQQQGEEGAGQEGVDELAREPAVLHDPDSEAIQPTRQEDTRTGRDDG